MMEILSCPSPPAIIRLLSQRDQILTYEAFITFLTHYRKTKLPSEGKLVHSLTCEYTYDRSTFISNCFIEMYGNCGYVSDAKAVFSRIRKPDFYSWHILMKACGQNGLVDDAYAFFSQMPCRNDVSWNTMISAFAQNGHGRRTLELFHQMQLTDIKPNRLTLVSVLDACAELADLTEGVQVHSLLDVDRNEIDVVLGTALITMYGKCGAIKEAKTVFDEMADHDVISWTAIIAAFSQNGHGTEAFEYFIQMQLKGFKADKAAFICAIDACAGLEFLDDGRKLHMSTIESGFECFTGIGNALVSMYGKCKRLRDARDTFNRIAAKDLVSWTTIIGACAVNVEGTEGLKWYNQMITEGIIPNKVTFLGALDACAVTTAIRAGRELHTSIYHFGLHEDTMVGNALVNMYSKCGSLSDAKLIFDNLLQRDVVCYTSMIATLSQTGHIKDAFSLLKQMEKEGIKPNDTTFVCTLNACSHSGQIDAARLFFYSMNQEHGLPYRTDHYVCMIDLLGRAGHLDEAEELIAHIPGEQATVAWLCLLGACKIHGDTERAARATSFCHELDPNDITSYVTLTNILSSSRARPLEGFDKQYIKYKHCFPNLHLIEPSSENSYPNLQKMGVNA